MNRQTGILGGCLALVLLCSLVLVCGGGLWAANRYFQGPDSVSTSAQAEPDAAVDPTVEKLREELDKDPDKLDERLTGSDAVDVVDLGMGEVPGKGKRSILWVDGNLTNCEEPGKPVPTRCVRIEGTPFWACNGQILRDCPECPIPPSPTPTTVTQSSATPTTVPPTGVPPTTGPLPSATPTTVPPTGVPPTTGPLPSATPTTIPPTKPPFTSQPPKEPTSCPTCIDAWKVDEQLGSTYGSGLWVPEGGECAFEHRPGPNTIDMTCPKEYYCTVDTLDGFFLFEGRDGLRINGVWGATARWRPWEGYKNETLATIFEGEWCHAANRAPNWEEGKKLRAFNKYGVEEYFPTPSPERCTIRNRPRQ